MALPQTRRPVGETLCPLDSSPQRQHHHLVGARRRWSIEGFFKTIKHRFGLHRFAQQTLKGVYRWLMLCFLSFVLVHWVTAQLTPKRPLIGKSLQLLH
ncbi:transposase [Leptolyngbya sp. O-77]|uniref:transposase n=1 Tax=Leptolyngbya sp. O-77 TaxID=1080068 RepID=UPI0018D29C8B|nr:transposase [Leptolyngbya sp. O-77]